MINLNKFCATNEVEPFRSYLHAPFSEGQFGDSPLWFRFDGGVGAMMPIRGQFSEHVEIEQEPAVS